MSQRNLADLIIRVRKAQKNLGANNSYRALLDECVEAIYAVVRQYADLQEQHAATANVDAGVARDRGAGSAEREGHAATAGDGGLGLVAGDSSGSGDTPDTNPLGYGHAV